MTKQISHLTSGRLLARNTVWNLLGQLLPMAVAVVAVPPLVRNLGVARFGVLSMAWIVIGYFSLFDLGIGRALTKLVADKLGAGEDHEIPPLAWTALFLMLLLGFLAGLATLGLSPWLVHKALKVPSELQAETLRGFYLLALSIPMVTVTSGLRGILEAQQRFAVLNLIRVPMSTFSFAGPLLVLPFSHSLVPVIAVLVFGRVIGYVAHQAACFHSLPALRNNVVFRGSTIPSLLKIGGWMTVSNLVGPLTFYVDRFFVGVALSVGAVAYYSAPFDMVSRLLVVPGAISGVLFPAFAVSSTQDQERTGLLLDRAVQYTWFLMFPPVLVIVAFAPEILHLWLGAAFAEHSGIVLRWLALGILVNAVTVIPFALLQGAGRPDITGKVLLLDLTLYSGVAWMLIVHFGIKGAAIAWVGRVALESIVFFAFCYRYLSREVLSSRRSFAAACVSILSLYVSTLLPGIPARIAFLACVLFVFAWTGWMKLLTPDERTFITRSLRHRAERDAPSISATTSAGATNESGIC
jgi:O-antigen/teichoic acid export membrane protein